MAPIAIDDTTPDGTLAFFDEQDKLQEVYVHSLATGKKVVLFGVPRAFTPTCSMQHVPGFIEKSEELKAKGVEDLLLISVNDPFVMKAWKKSYAETKNVKFLGDGPAKYTHALGLELDLPFRERTRGSFKEVVVANIESGGEFTVSSADDILATL
ncbi:hypothetical protein OSB04_031495 [Centaurea solstitialis]|uniref:Glutaredoxin-dependent peroxiredoxin n=1 Tax=Centaurea solstitialis TaxID=347529 RepID=A0AA38VUD4_9ASTR|nr:hypothetical protein OSB04_031495 [Centaurea solstitialis]